MLHDWYLGNFRPKYHSNISHLYRTSPVNSTHTFPPTHAVKMKMTSPAHFHPSCGLAPSSTGSVKQGSHWTRCMPAHFSGNFPLPHARRWEPCDPTPCHFWLNQEWTDLTQDQPIRFTPGNLKLGFRDIQSVSEIGWTDCYKVARIHQVAWPAEETNL